MPPGANDPHEARRMPMPLELCAPIAHDDAGAWEGSARGVCEAACAALVALPGADGAAAILWGADAGDLAVAEAGIASGAGKAIEQSARGLQLSTLPRAAVIDDAASMPAGEARSALLAAGIRAICVAPIVVAGAPAGLLALCRAAPGGIGDSAAAGAVSIAAQAAEAVGQLERERSLRAERDLLAGGPLVVFRWRNAPGWPVEYVSANVRAVLGVPAAEFTSGRVPFASMIHADDAPRVLAAADVAAAVPPGPRGADPAPLEQRYRLVRPDGRIVHVRDVTRVIRDATGRVTHHDGYLLELSADDRDRPPPEGASADQAMEGAVRLAGGMAHEFNNLLTAIGGSAARALDRLPASSPARGDVERIVGAVERASAVTRKLLAISGRQVAAARTLDLSGVVRSAEPRLRTLVPSSVRVQTELAADLRAITADAGQVEEAVACLVANAAEAMPAGGVLTIGTRNEPDGRVILSVGDSGRGLDANALGRLAEPFYTSKPHSAGLGMGLPTVRAIAQRWGASLRLDSLPGRGTVATISWLPAAAGALPAAIPAPETRLRTAGETILLAEDQDLVRRLMAAMLRDQGYTVLEAEDGPAALRVAEGHDEPIHLLLTDAVMPGMDGVEVAGRLRRSRPDVKTLVVSGYTEDAALRGRLEEGSVEFLAKPFTPDELGRAVRRVLDGPVPGAE